MSDKSKGITRTLRVILIALPALLALVCGGFAYVVAGAIAPSFGINAALASTVAAIAVAGAVLAAIILRR